MNKPQIILIMGLLTCLYACKIALVIVIIDDKNIETPSNDKRGAVYSISSLCEENNKLKMGLLKADTPKLAGIDINAVNFKEVEMEDISFSLFLSSMAPANIGTSGKAMALINVDGRLYIDTAIVLYEP